MSGFTVEELSEDRLQAQAPRTGYSNLLGLDRWFPAGRIVIERSSAGITIYHRPPFRRMAMSSITTGLFAALIAPGRMSTRLAIAAAAASLLLILQLRGARRHRTLLAIGGAVEGNSAEIPKS